MFGNKNKARNSDFLNKWTTIGLVYLVRKRTKLRRLIQQNNKINQNIIVPILTGTIKKTEFSFILKINHDLMTFTIIWRFKNVRYIAQIDSAIGTRLIISMFDIYIYVIIN